MSDQSPLIVPLVVEAFVVNDVVRTSGNAFMRFEMVYGVMWKLQNGQPGLNANDVNFTSTGIVEPSGVSASAYYNGIYLKWRLPAAFTTGVQDSVTGVTTYPPVPNRWVVVRYAGTDVGNRTATAWLVESDYLWSGVPKALNASQIGSLYVQVEAGPPPAPASVYMGRNVLLGTWTESGQSLGLTAMAPGNPCFAFYQPQCNNIFSFIDPLDGQPAQTISYEVFGWLSDLTDDPLAGVAPADFAAAIAALGWSLPAGTDPTASATWTMCAGSVTGVQWQTTAAPGGGAPTGAVSIAVGNSSAEAVTALVSAQTSAVDAELLEALQLGSVDVLDRPDGAALLAERLQRAAYQRSHAGYAWQIVDAPDANTPVTPAELAAERAWLAPLDAAQAALDAAELELSALQGQLYVAWWQFASWLWCYQGQTILPNLRSDALLKDALDPTIGGSIAQQVAAQQAEVAALAALVPSGDTPAALAAAIAAYSTAHDLPATRVLKRSARGTFYLANNPVVLFGGDVASGIVAPVATTLCRFPSQLVTGITFDSQSITSQTPGLSIPQPDLSGVSGVPWSAALAASLVIELFFVDPTDATAIAAAIGSSDVSGIAAAQANPACAIGWYPVGAVTAWTQNPWHPLQLIWQAYYYPIGYGPPATPAWAFDGEAYAWSGENTVGAMVSVGGLIQLTSAAVLNLESQIAQFITNNPSLPAAELEAFEQLLAYVQGESLLSQGLDGFGQQLRLGMPGVFLAPSGTTFATTPPLADLLGPVGSYPPSLGEVPVDTIPASNFQPWRAGQLLFTNLLVVDEWGQAVWPIDLNNYLDARLYLPPDLTPVLVSPSAQLVVADGAAIASLAPAAASAGSGDVQLAVTGVGFDSTTIVTWNGGALATTYGGPTSLGATVPAALLASAGVASVWVGAGPTASFTVASGPAITALAPALIAAGMAPTAEVPLTVTGVGFAAGAVVAWNGAALATAFVDASTLAARIPAELLAAPAAIAVTVIDGGGATSPAATFTVSPGAAIASLSPALVAAGSDAFALSVAGVGFTPSSVIWAGEAALATTFVDATQLTAAVPAAAIATAATIAVTEQIGTSVLPGGNAALLQVPPALLQPARVAFAGVGDDPIAGWVLPDHLDGALAAYDPTGASLGRLSLALPATGPTAIWWTPAPGSPYATLAEVAAAVPYLGAFLLALSQTDPATFTAMLDAIDETLWTTVPMDAVFDQNLAVLVGRPLALVRAQLQLQLDGAPYLDPSWQFVGNPQTPAITGYQFPIQLGNLTQLDDGLIGYFVGDDYTVFDIVPAAGATPSSYLRPIGVDGNYLYLPFDGTTSVQLSLLVDPRAPVHASTAILPVAQLAVPSALASAALARMAIDLPIHGVLTDEQIAAGADAKTTVLVPAPSEASGTWTWLENDEGTWTSYAVAPNDASARLSPVPPVLRRGYLRLSSALGKDGS